MVLIRQAISLGVLAWLLVGCGQSLFDASGPDRGRDGGGGDDDELGRCNAPCIADAAADFDGTPTGDGGHWRYLDDLGNRQWVAMAPDGTQMTGNEGRNRITTCLGRRDLPACEALPRALLVTSAGGAGGAGVPMGSDPAIEFTASSAQVIELRVLAFLPSGDDQVIRLYRNSREDVVFTGVARPGMRLEQTVLLDALAGDRFLVAVSASSPTAGGATDLGLHLTINAVSASFPSTCQRALAFEVQTGNTVQDRCQGEVFALFKDSGTQGQLFLKGGPFVEQGYAADLSTGTHFLDISGDALAHEAGLTVQLWVELKDVVGFDPMWLFSDLTGDGAGLGIAIASNGTAVPVIVAAAYSGQPFEAAHVEATAPFPLPQQWHFVRVVHTDGEVAVCVDGARVASAAVVNSVHLKTFEHVALGTEGGSALSHFVGELDDVRAITGALPCE